MESALAIANYFIKKSWDTGIPVTNMKLVKLVYISHGWYLGLSGVPLLTEQPQAWKYGPVIPSIYYMFKEYGSSPITKLASTINEYGHTVVYDISDTTLYSFLDKIWELYGKYDGIQLSAMTHKNDTPWEQTWSDKGWTQNSVVIPNDLIKNHYNKLVLKQGQNINA